jgi:hypothetical protein
VTSLSSRGAGDSRKLVARLSDASKDSTSCRRASFPRQASVRYAARASAGSARAFANTSFTRDQSSGRGATGVDSTRGRYDPPFIIRCFTTSSVWKLTSEADRLAN